MWKFLERTAIANPPEAVLRELWVKGDGLARKDGSENGKESRMSVNRVMENTALASMAAFAR